MGGRPEAARRTGCRPACESHPHIPGFPLRRLVKRLPATGRENYLGESLQEAIEKTTAANLEILEALNQIQMCLGIPEWTNKGVLVEELIDCLGDFEEEMIEYEHLEREELFPRVREFCLPCAKEEGVRPC